ncbi:MAG: phosphatidate cytidylyltransferase, partial [Chitinophagales bacterium]|nr:phosphatidate cytidylyltransferase [Chitinophagales bacterium]
IVHFFIVHIIAVVICYFTALFLYVAILIVLTGAYELVILGYPKKQSVFFYFFSAIIYCLSAYGFLYMANIFSGNELLFVFLLVFTFDGFSQVSGQLFGKNKLFPQTSPNKTIEGLTGGSLFAFLTAWLIRNWINEPPLHILLICCILIIAALSGDWLASYYKRKHSVKDYSNLIPGHGGVLDRFDSWIFASAVAAILFKL